MCRARLGDIPGDGEAVDIISGTKGLLICLGEKAVRKTSLTRVWSPVECLIQVCSQDHREGSQRVGFSQERFPRRGRIWVSKDRQHPLTGLGHWRQDTVSTGCVLKRIQGLRSSLVVRRAWVLEGAKHWDIVLITGQIWWEPVMSTTTNGAAPLPTAKSNAPRQTVFFSF